MGDNKDKTKQTTGSMPQESSQVGTHGQTGSKHGGQGKDWSQGEGSQGKGQGQDRGQGQPMSPNQGQDSYGSGGSQGSQGNQGSQRNQGSQGNWNDPAQRDMAQGDQTMPAQPSGTSPLDKDQQPVNQNRGQQNRG